MDDASTADASFDTSTVDATPRVDASVSNEQRKAYGAAMTEGRTAAATKKYAPAIDAFTRALVAAPEDPRALAERGHARLLSKDLDGANADLTTALAMADPNDMKLKAQIELDRGALDDALADMGKAPERRGVAVGHYRRANELSPSAAAAAHMSGCPASWGPIETRTFAAVTEASMKLGHPEMPWTRLATGAFFRNRSDTFGTEVLVPIDGARYAFVLANSTTRSTCGALGELDVSDRAGVWRVEVRAQGGASSKGACSCEGEPCVGECGCKEPFCPQDCTGADRPLGEHQEIYIDGKTGAGVWQLRVDQAFASELTLDVDLATHRFRATGLGCIADLPLSK